MDTIQESTTRQVELAIGGMTCAACASRVSRKLNRVNGVVAVVNYATERATVTAPSDVDLSRLVEVVADAGYTASPVSAPPPDPSRALWRRLVVAVVLTFPLGDLSLVVSLVPGARFPGWQWVCLALALPVVTWSAWPFHRAAARNLRHGGASMDTLVSLGVLCAFGWSLVGLFGGGRGIYLETAAGVTTFLLAGRYFEARAKRTAGDALRALSLLGASSVAVLRDGVEVRLPVEHLAVGALFVVRPGERIAADGVVEDGRSTVDVSMMTGESLPVEVEAGAAVVGGTIALDGRVVVRATGVGADSYLARMAKVVEEAQSGDSRAQRLADRVSAVFVPVVLVLALLTLVAWLLLGNPGVDSFGAALAVLIIACPCALGLATPTALLVATGRGARMGILIRGPRALEATRGVDVVLLDKTGTVTTGRMVVREVLGDVLRAAGAVEAASSHSIARAVVAAAGAPLPPVSGFRALPGLGAVGVVEGREVVVGRASLFDGWVFPAEVSAVAAGWESAGWTVVVVGWDGRVEGLVALSDQVKPGADAAVRSLRALGVRPVLVTGDNEGAARCVADAIGVDEVHAAVLPEGKVALVRSLRAAGHRVAVVGDGVNDGPALAAADLGLAVGAGTDVALAAADVILVREGLDAVPDAIRLARRTLRVIRENLVWAFGYNVAALPVAALGLLNPFIAGAAMALSSVFVVSNSMRLRTFE
ncbi:heavy metal translocating P-type ATPase [Umezawaea sp.]|uniref:heavy metal translocating P-type ATPase n=1 Tax=Umezawaea sp. TaxID=1955258 RepID=UPI002ED61E71